MLEKIWCFAVVKNIPPTFLTIWIYWKFLKNVMIHIAGFLPVLQRGDQNAARMYPEMELDKEAWYIYCKDGHGGICCFRLNDE